MEVLDATGYTIGRLVLVRGLGALFFVAFLGALLQFRGLIGSRGLLPVPEFVAATPFRHAPSVFHLHYSDRFFAAVAGAGLLLSAGTVAGVTERLPLPAYGAVWMLIWALYLSIVDVGRVWYSFGWESLLLEAGVLAAFAGNAETAPPWLVLLLVRWLLFRVEFGAGMIKWRGDRCWRDLTCLYHHHETQPMPGPLSRWFHLLPRPLHRVEVVGNHVTQLAVPFALFLPQPVAGTAAGIMIVTQLWLVASGNFAWLNWITIVLAASVIPDGFYRAVFGAGETVYAPTPVVFTATVMLLTVLVAVLSRRPVQNLLSPRQAMNASFNRWHFVNAYGAFGSITRVRREVIVEGTTDIVDTPATRWLEYEFKGKPGDVLRRPRQFAPYHLRLDWLMWFAAISREHAEGWFPRFAAKLLDGEPCVSTLLRHNPFPDTPPARVRARLFRYRFTTRAEHRATGAWWVREELGVFMAPMARADLAPFRPPGS
ncbi:MAG: lipase maturation factor family protein [Rhodococcus sp.]|uniref:lipase maturation factor family protein n=1 Tax=Rhodococcus TaxID=1827 RepID=UPI0016AEC79D|nr:MULTISPECIES: lipase maturation factor family protein [Rhodococcus]NLV79840.1 lipase maturation factor family protein [Rhodococcus sp. (in: high G+C Gram-positive bacteria)]